MNVEYGELVSCFQIEECVLESLAWKSDSPLWETIKAQTDGIPLSSEVSCQSSSFFITTFTLHNNVIHQIQSILFTVYSFLFLLLASYIENTR